MNLPLPVNGRAFCQVSALEGGTIRMLTSFAVKNAPPEDMITTPCLAFLLVHSETGHRFLFDLGIRKDWENLPPPAIEFLKKHPENIAVDEDVIEALAKGGISPSDIDTICISHAHFDHLGDPSLFPNSTFILGAETEGLVENGYPKNPASTVAADLFPGGRTRYLSDSDVPWQPIGPFPRAFDFFGDGSIYIIDAPGHFPGHINLLARTSADGGWIYLAGDSVHHWDILEGKAEVAYGHPIFGHTFCLHQNKEAAEEQIRQIREVLKLGRVRVLLAHDEPWYNVHKGGDSFWPGAIPSL